MDSGQVWFFFLEGWDHGLEEALCFDLHLLDVWLQIWRCVKGAMSSPSYSACRLLLKIVCFSKTAREFGFLYFGLYWVWSGLNRKKVTWENRWDKLIIVFSCIRCNTSYLPSCVWSRPYFFPLFICLFFLNLFIHFKPYGNADVAAKPLDRRIKYWVSIEPGLMNRCRKLNFAEGGRWTSLRLMRWDSWSMGWNNL